jgi:predicted permease
MEEAYQRDLARGVRPRRATWRYAANLLGTVGSLGAAALRRGAHGGFLLDARVALRTLTRQPLLTGVVMLALGLGIPAALTVRHALDAFFSPLPVPGGERILGVRHYDVEARDPLLATVHDLADWTASLTTFEQLGAARTYMVNVRTDDPGAAPVPAAQITASSFGILRAKPLLGRLLDASDEAAGAPDVVLLGEDLWASRFGADPDIVGVTVRLGPKPYTVVGVMPSDFLFPSNNQIWLPLRATPTGHPVGQGPRLLVYGRLADGAEVEDARREIRHVTERAAAADPARYAGRVGEAVPMPILLLFEDDMSRNRNDMRIIQGIIFALLLLVSGNVGTLVLARTAARTGEIAVRTALGASRARVVGQLFVETLVLAVLSTGAGLLVGEGAARWVTGLLEPHGLLPYWVDLSLTPRTVATAFALAVACAGVAGIVPALKATRSSVQGTLQRAASGGASIRFGLGSSALIVGEVALSVGFLAVVGTVVKTGLDDRSGELGFDPDHFVTASLTVPSGDLTTLGEYADSAATALRVRETQQALLRALQADPQVVGVGIATSGPGTMTAHPEVELEAPLPEDAARELGVGVVSVDVGYFAGLHREILAGRDFNAGDVDGGPGARHRAVIVNEGFQKKILGGRSAVGRRFRYRRAGQDETAPKEWFEIVGVVGSFGMNPINPTRDMGVYHPLAPGEVNPIQYVVEVSGDTRAFLPRLRSLASGVDDEATTSAATVADRMQVQESLFRWIFRVQLILASIGFLLAVTGLYALMAFTVAQRRREIGIRTALGARAGSIVFTVARRALLQLGVGLGAGAAVGAFLLDRIQWDAIMASPDIPATVGVTIACAALVGLLACAAPTLRGLRIQPTEALRDL